MSVSLSKILQVILFSLNYLKEEFIADVLQEAFQNIQSSASDLFCEISKLFKTAILKNNQGQLLLNFLFYTVRLIV